MKFDILSRVNNAVIFTAELDARFESERFSVQMGAAVKEAVKAKANLRGANLRGADLRGADLGGVDLGGSDLYGANLRGADLRGADLGGADLTGVDLGEGVKAVRLIARLTRIIDPYEFFAWRVEDGRCLIYAGCRQGWTVEQFTAHTAEYSDAAKRDETLAILEFIAGRDKADAAKFSIDSNRGGDK